MGGWGARRGTGIHDASHDCWLDQRPDTILDSQASINFSRKSGEGRSCMDPRGVIRERETKLCYAGKGHLHEAQTENKKRSGVNEWVD